MAAKKHLVRRPVPSVSARGDRGGYLASRLGIGYVDTPCGAAGAVCVATPMGGYPRPADRKGPYMSDVQARIVELEAQVASLKAEVALDEQATSRRGLLKKVALGAAAAGAGAVAMSRPAAASSGTFADAEHP